MWKKIWAFLSEMASDGYAVLAVTAAPLSIAFTLAKAFDVQALGHLKEVSYAWAFTPLTLWFFVAYVRRRAAHGALLSSGEPAPDWTIHELFYYIDSNVLETRQDVGLDFMDHAATGRLRTWGRIADQGRTMPLTELGTDFWRNATLTFWFLAENHDDAVHAETGGLLDRVSYRDVRVSKAQATRIWPK